SSLRLSVPPLCFARFSLLTPPPPPTPTLFPYTTLFRSGHRGPRLPHAARGNRARLRTAGGAAHRPPLRPPGPARLRDRAQPLRTLPGGRPRARRSPRSHDPEVDREDRGAEPLRALLRGLRFRHRRRALRRRGHRPRGDAARARLAGG